MGHDYALVNTQPDELSEADTYKTILHKRTHSL